MYKNRHIIIFAERFFRPKSLPLTWFLTSLFVPKSLFLTWFLSSSYVCCVIWTYKEYVGWRELLNNGITFANMKHYGNDFFFETSVRMYVYDNYLAYSLFNFSSQRSDCPSYATRTVVGIEPKSFQLPIKLTNDQFFKIVYLVFFFSVPIFILIFFLTKFILKDERY